MSKNNSELKDKLLQCLLNHYCGIISAPAFSSNSELLNSLNSFNSKFIELINESNNNGPIKTSVKELENNEDDKLEPWHLQQLLNTINQQSTQQVQQQQQQQQQNNQFNNGSGRRSVNSNSSNSSLVNCNNNSTITTNLELDNKLVATKNSPTTGFNSSYSRNSPNNNNQTMNPFSLNGSLLNSNLVNNNSNNLNSNHHQTTNSTNSSSNSFTNRTRIRTSFDPEHELPKLHRWFAENQHPTRPQIQEYVRILNNLDSRRGRKPLDVNNVVYWFKNNRASFKRGGSGRIGQSPQLGSTQNLQLNGQSLNSNNNNNLSNDQVNTNDLMFAHQQRQLVNQLQLEILNQHHQSPNIAELFSSGAGKNILNKLMLKNPLIDEDALLNCEQNEDDDDQQMNEFGHQSKDSDDDEQNEGEDTSDQTFSNFAQTLDLSIKQQQQQQTMGNNLKRRKIDTSSTFDECDEQDEKESSGSASPINHQLSSINNKRNNQLNNKPSQRYNSLSKQLNTLKSISQGLNPTGQQQRHMLLDQVNQDKDDNQQLVNSDGELDDENQESDGELDEKNYYASVLNANRNNNSINQLAQNLVGNNLAANFINQNYIQTVNDLFLNRLMGNQPNNVANALSNNSLLSSAAGLIAASSANNLNSANSHPLSALTGNSNAFGQNNLLSSLNNNNNNSNSPDESLRRIRRSRTFIDPITEVPRLEQWFSQNTHPSHSQIVCYTDELNKLPYRQKFPKLEPKNVQFWFKNRRAKFKRVGLTTNQPLNQTNSSTVSLTTTSQSNSQSDSPTPPGNNSDSLLCMNGNREFVAGRLVH